MTWGKLCRTVRRAILREAVRRGVDVEAFFRSIGGVM